MGPDATATVDEIREIRQRIDGRLEALEASLPSRGVLVDNLALAALGGAAATLVGWYILHRWRLRRQDKRVKRLVREVLDEAGVT